MIGRIVGPWGERALPLQLEKPKRGDLLPLEVAALADTGSLFLCIPQAVQAQLQLEATSQKTVTTGDGMRTICPYVGLLRVRFEKSGVLCGSGGFGRRGIYWGGAVPMEDMDLVVVPPLRRGMINPLHPNFGEGPVKRFVIED